MSDETKVWQQSNHVEKNRASEPGESPFYSKEVLEKIQARMNEQFVARRSEEAARRLRTNYDIKDDVNGKLYDKDTGVVLLNVSDKKLSTRFSDPRTVKNVVDAAEVKGWSDIKVSGTHEFRQAVWVEATSRGIKAQGYAPDRDDWDSVDAKLEREKERSESRAQAKTIDKELNQQKKNETRMILLDHGEAPYKFNNKNANSYFVKMKIDGKETTTWSKGFEEVIKESGAMKGEEVTLKKTAVKVVNLYDKSKKEQYTVNRPEWTIERDKGMVIAEAAAKTLIGTTAIHPNNVKKVEVALAKELTARQSENKIPAVKVYDTDKKTIDIARRKQDLERKVPEPPSQDVSASRDISR